MRRSRSGIEIVNGSALGEGEGEANVSTEQFFQGYGQEELNTAVAEAPVAAAIVSTGMDVEANVSQDQYTTPLPSNAAWSDSVDRIISDIADDVDSEENESLLD
ncbi:MAG: hypothetical protein VX738_11540 [Planctomycetota bacterium]|nr:hypothetical protein [Planctomycetota bacterium]